MIGKLIKTENNWLISHNNTLTKVYDGDIKYLYDMLDGRHVEFSIITVAEGTSEFDVTDVDVAKLTFEDNFFQNELHNNFIVSDDYRNKHINYNAIIDDLSEGMDSEFEEWLKVIIVRLKNKNYKIVKIF